MTQSPFAATAIKHWAGFAMIIGGVLCTDQSLKFQAEKTHMTWSDPIVTLGYRATRDSINVWFAEFTQTYVRNPGAAWGRGRNMDIDVKNMLFVSVLAVAFVLCGILLRIHRTSSIRIGCALLIGGALGNQMDRSVLGYVIDWLHVSWHIGSWRVSFPVLNFADLAICAGVPLIAWEVIRLNHKGTSGA